MPGKIKILVFLALWKRPRITELCFIGLNRLRQHPDFDIQVLAVVSEPEMHGLCERYGVTSVTHTNLPLGAKKNFGLQCARSLDFDYLMEIGSDTIILNELLDVYRSEYIGTSHFFGVGDCAFICSETRECRRLSGASTYGIGRMISRSALETMEFRIWPDDRNKGLDNASIHKMAMQGGFFYKQIKPGPIPLAIDIKSEENIWPFNHLDGVKFDVKRLLDRMSVEEVDFLEGIWSEHVKQ